MDISIIIPAFNEEKRLASTLDKIYGYLSAKDWQYEVIVVDDGSLDKTKEVALASSLNKSGKLILLQNHKNMGKGYSVKAGIFASKFEYTLFSDADLSTPIEEVEKLSFYISSGFDIAIGSRSIPGSDVKVHQPFYRESMGRLFNWLVQFFVFKGIIDTQCGFKLFKSRVAKELAACLAIDGFSFDVEMLYLALKRGYQVKEVPVIWLNSSASRVNPVIDSAKMFWDILRIKRIHCEK